jgi:hypothetical protein
MTGWRKRWTYRAGLAVAFGASFLTVWTTIVRDDGTAIGYFLVVMAIGVGWFAASFRPAGMARTMLGVAIMQALFGVAVATAPSIAKMPDGAIKALLFSGFFTALWLISAAFFRAASKKEQKVVVARWPRKAMGLTKSSALPYRSRST